MATPASAERNAFFLLLVVVVVVVVGDKGCLAGDVVAIRFRNESRMDRRLRVNSSLGLTAGAVVAGETSSLSPSSRVVVHAALAKEAMGDWGVKCEGSDVMESMRPAAENSDDVVAAVPPDVDKEDDMRILLLLLLLLLADGGVVDTRDL